MLTAFMFLCMNIGFVMYNPFSHIAGVIVLLGISLFLLLKYKKKLEWKLSRKLFYASIIAIFLFVSFLQAIICYNVQLAYYSDFIIAREQAMFLTDNFSIKPEFLDYFHSYPYNIDTVLVLSWLYKLTGDYHAVEFITSSLSNIAAVITGLTVYNVTKNRMVSIITIIFTEIFLLFCLKTYLPYSSNLVILFPILIVYVYTAKLSKLWKIILMTIFVVIGYRIKLTALIPYIGILMIEGYDTIKNKDYKSAGTLVASIAVLFTMFGSLRNIALDKLNFHSDPTMEHDFVYYIALGQNNELGGQFNKKIAVLGDVHMPKEKRDTLFRNIAIRSFTERSAVQHAKFFVGKIAICWGEVYQDHLEIGKLDSLLLMLRHYVWYFALLCMTIGSYLINDKRYRSLLLGIAGVVFYLYLSEAGARYVIMYSPIVFFMMGWILSCKKMDKQTTTE